MKKQLTTILFSLLSLICIAQEKLSLEQCLDSARLYNHALQNAALSIDAANLTVSEARTHYYPTVAANVMAFYAFDKMMKGDGTIPAEVAAISPALAAYAGQPYAIRELNSAYNATLSVMQPIYAGGQIHTANKLAELQRDVNHLKYSMELRELEQKITENYWQIVTVKYNLSTLDAADRQVGEVYRQVEQFLNAGLCNQNDLLRVKLRQQELASQRLRLNNAQHVLLLLLAQQIGLANHNIDIESGVPNDKVILNDQLSFANGQNNREEIALATKAIETAELQIKMERAKLMPTVGVGLVGYNVGIGGLSSTTRNIVKTNQLNAMVAATVSVPISAWWGGSKAIKRRKLELQQSQNTLLDTQEKIRVDIESAWADLRQAYQQIDIARASVEQAAENLRISSLQYKAGTETLSNLLDAETLNRQAQNSLSNALADYQRSKAVYLLKSR